MARRADSSGPQRLRHSLLERLLDDHPDESRDRPSVQRPRAEHLIVSVLRDVEALLNTVRSWPPSEEGDPAVDPAAGDGPLAASLLSYGVPNFAELSADDPASARVQAESIRLTLERFEPRLEEVRVTPVLPGEGEPTTAETRSVMMHVSAVLRMDPLRERLQLTTEIDTRDGHCVVAAPELSLTARSPA